MLEKADLVARADQLPHMLSGGLQRRLSICCSLVGSPSIVVLDEPTTGTGAFVCACVRACVYECVRMCMRMCVFVCVPTHTWYDKPTMCTSLGGDDSQYTDSNTNEFVFTLPKHKHDRHTKNVLALVASLLL